MQPRPKKSRTIRFIETEKEIKCNECYDCCSKSELNVFDTFDNWMFIHADIFHRTPETLRSDPPRRKILPIMAERTTPEQYRKLKKQATRRRQFKGI